MASIIGGYSYDIFISYRQKDNKGDRWVSEFVDALKDELESTFKEEISVYFDINPHDGLLETHDVNASLKEKLKCLVFIPIISRTYCDPKSFAWKHEFKAFVEQASDDQFGLKIKLPNGNVTSRVLPVRIYDLDSADIKQCESVLGSVLRGVEFIYKEPGVNRPLSANEDNLHNNLNHTTYRNQINKVANAVKEVITSMDQHEQKPEEVSREVYKPISVPLKSNKSKIIVGAILVLALILLCLFFIPKLFKSSAPVDKSIAVLPFDNLSNDPKQDYIGDGMMQEILNHLFKIEGLKIPSSTSSMRYKGSKLSVREIAREMGVTYVLEGNVRRSGDNIRIIVSLINGKDERLKWTEGYDKTMTATNLLEIQSNIAQQVAEKLEIVINPEVKKRIETKSTINTEAYTLFWQALNIRDSSSFDEVRSLLERAIILDPNYSDAYAGLAFSWINSGGHGGGKTREQVLEKAEPLLKKALQLDNNSLLAHTAMATLRLYYFWDFESVEKEFQICIKLNPSNSELSGVFSDYLLASGKYHEALLLTKNAFDKNKNLNFDRVQMALAYYYDGQQEKALETIDAAHQLYPNDDFAFINFLRLLVYMAKYDKAIEIFEKSLGNKQFPDIIPYYLGHLGIAYSKTNNKSKSTAFLNELIRKSRISPNGSPSFFAAGIYAAMGENNNAFQMLEKAFTDHEVEMYWLKVEPLFRPLHGDPQFENLLLKIGFK